MGRTDANVSIINACVACWVSVVGRCALAAIAMEMFSFGSQIGRSPNRAGLTELATGLCDKMALSYPSATRSGIADVVDFKSNQRTASVCGHFGFGPHPDCVRTAGHDERKWREVPQSD